MTTMDDKAVLVDTNVLLAATAPRRPLHEAALAVQEAVDIRRFLAEQRPDAFRPDFAMSLNNLGNRLSDLGRYEKAHEATQEAVVSLAGSCPNSMWG